MRTAFLAFLLVPLQDDPLAREARAALERAAAFYRSISTHGGYLWRYSEDLQDRWGEGKATATQVWVQAPGTPAVGMAFLRAWEATKDARHLDAARAAAEALAHGQLESGGWTYHVDFDPAWGGRYYRRADRGKLPAGRVERLRNVTTFDDDTTQGAVRFLMAAAAAAGDAGIKDTLDFALRGMLAAQLPSGAWPQGHPAAPGRYWGHATLNDHCLRDCVLTMLEAHRRYGKAEHLEAARRGGDFLILAQLPAPQAAWAQQYDADLKPAWARKFEPPSVTAGESSGALRTLVDLHLATGEEKYLKPIPAVIDWFQRSMIAPDTWARFYELGTNRPLYFTKDYKLVYTDDDLPTHYSFKGSYGIRQAIALYEEVKRLGRETFLERRKAAPARGEARRKSLAPRVREAVATLDARGRWVTGGRIESRVFIENVGLLSDYLEASAP